MIPSGASDDSDRYSSNDSEHRRPAPRIEPASDQSPSQQRERRHSHRQEQQPHRASCSSSDSSVSVEGRPWSTREVSLSPSLVPLAYGYTADGQPAANDGLPVFATNPMYGRPQPRRPLIDLVKNEWMSDSKYAQMFSPGAERGEPRWLAMVRAPRLRRHVLLYTLLLLSIFVGLRWGRPRWMEYTALHRSADTLYKTANGLYGVNMRPQFADMIHLKTLSEDLVPGSERHKPKEGKGGSGDKRLVIVGDVHGCKDELVKLLDEVSFNRETDHLVVAGDMISKGPDSPAVVDMLRDMGASCVRGNHEDRVLLAHRDLKRKHVPLAGPEEPLDRSNDHMDEESFNHGDYTDRALAQQLSSEQVNYLRACPVILNVGSIDGMGNVVVVHGGLVPGVALGNQDAYNVMNMRTIDLESHVPSENRDGVAWTRLWNRYQDQLPSEERSFVVYGHDAGRGLSINEYSKGIDSGCFRGGKLTAFIVEGGKGKVSSTLASVACKDYQTEATASRKKKSASDQKNI
ncbi:MAG: hypothetical protein M1837_007554 [Sclerophora amabilis]|nr:MAG: hypothetical protein M1837_007554 [Sclerophora amabilis]